MRRVARAARRRFGPSAARVSVRTEWPWFWRLGLALLLVASGFLAGYWRYAYGNTAALREQLSTLEQENRSLRTQAIQVERQKQVTHVAQTDLAQDLAALQAENSRLKEDVTFYRSILEESPGAAVIRLHSIKVTKASRPGEYQYRVTLIQSGKHDRNVQGQLQLAVLGRQNGKPMVLTVVGGNSKNNGKVNFKYYQPLEGSFAVPVGMTVQDLQAKFFQGGSTEPKLTQTVLLTN